MLIEQRQWTAAAGWTTTGTTIVGEGAQLVLIFGAPSALLDSPALDDLRKRHPRAHLVGCSTAGEICGTRVSDDSIVATALRFEYSTIKVARINLRDVHDSRDAGMRLAAGFNPDGLRHILVLSDGLKVNGSSLVAGLRDRLPTGVAVTGGLSGDGPRFERTFVCLDGPPEEGVIAGIGFYGSRLHVGFGSLGGWDPFGPERLVTRSAGNVLHELEGGSALALYRKYLGEYSAGLPSTGLLFPLTLRSPDGGEPVVRTLLAIDEKDQSVTFAGDIPQGSYVRLMKANFERLIDGAVGAATTGLGAGPSPDLALLISCVGRKLVLKQRIEEEVEGVRDVLGERTILTGFYSYGEICPQTPLARCELHNQTMTITTFSER